MVMVHLRFEVDGVPQLSRVLTRVRDDIQDWRPAFEEMAEDFYATQWNVWAGEGAFEGLARWRPLSPRYRAWKEARFPGRPILVLTGRLRASLTRPGASGSVRRITERELVLGTSVRTPDGRYNLGMLHQRGTSRMPARPPMRLTEPQRSRWVGILHAYLWEDVVIKRLEEAGFREFRARLEREP